MVQRPERTESSSQGTSEDGKPTTTTTTGSTNFLPAKFDPWFLAFGRPGRSKGPILAFLGLTFLYAYPMYLFRCVPATWAVSPRAHFAFIALTAVSWVSFAFAGFKDPGYLDRGVVEDVVDDDDRVCGACRLRKPSGSKHCRVCDRCVDGFDHHCSYIDNCVGSGNATWFFVFNASVALTLVVTFHFARVCIAADGWHWTDAFGLMAAASFGGLSWLLLLRSVFGWLRPAKPSVD